MKEKDNPFNYFDNIVVTFSGGKDSTACLLWALDHFEHSKIRVIFEDSGVENPETSEYVKLLDSTLIHIDQIITKGFWDWLREIGRWPGVKFRWCTWRLKTEPTKEYLQGLSKPLVVFGMRALESSARSKYRALEYDPLFKCCRFHPIIDWDEKTVFSYILAHDLPINPAYCYAQRVGCWCCPLSGAEGMVNFGRIHPKVMAEGVRIEAEVGHRWTSEISLAQIAEIAKSQQPLNIQSENRLEHFNRYAPVPTGNFIFPEVTSQEIEQVLILKSPRGYKTINGEEHEQLYWDL